MNSYNFITVGPDGKKDEARSVFYRGPDAAKHCLEQMLRVGADLKGLMQAHRERKRLSPAEEAVFVHNLKGYDAHLLFTAVGAVEGNLKVIATNTEKYVSFKLENLVFKDSCQFLACSLDGLVRTSPHRTSSTQKTLLARLV